MTTVPTSGKSALRSRTGWLLFLLVLANVLNFIDRQLPYILAEAIKRDLQLSDTQIGILGGLAFSAVYGTLGIAIARVAERHGSKWVLAASLAVWSALTSAGGMAQNFAQFALTRLGVAAGEAGCTPAAHALISARFEPDRRSFPIAIFSLGIPLGTMLGLIAGGWISEHWSWRQAMVAIGLPGLALAVLVAATLPDELHSVSEKRREDLPLRTILPMLWKKRSFRHMAAGIAVYAMGANATIVFLPAFLMRTYGLSATGTGLSLGIVYGIAGVAGTLSGGALGDRLGKVDVRWLLRVPAIGLLVALPFTLGSWFAPFAALSIALLAVPKFANLLYIGPVFSALHRIAPANSRATASAFLLLFNNLIGLSLGPLLTGVLSDRLEPALGELSLRAALCLVPFTQAWAALHFLAASRQLKSELASPDE